ncbi:hypothetical protein AKUH3B110M_UNKNOWN200040 (plasmid) [Apilactobacillus kunkeei]|nr:hypothetical protein AKUH3B110M_UNKNOWN200040 [Apilactobacillus kunkeei]CAI2700361.1 hypothetical protein AKUH3B107A_UNKNOWN200040 [Apilactobacillus kunkeei]CAI2700376.1 hypothetical protein AKUH3B102X_UNKNOWN200040 [Apilactobacillus kunkeei]
MVTNLDPRLKNKNNEMNFKVLKLTPSDWERIKNDFRKKALENSIYRDIPDGADEQLLIQLMAAFNIVLVADDPSLKVSLGILYYMSIDIGIDEQVMGQLHNIDTSKTIDSDRMHYGLKFVNNLYFMRNDGEIIVNRIRLYHAFAFSILDILGIDYISNNEPKGILLKNTYYKNIGPKIINIYKYREEVLNQLKNREL